MSIKEIKEAIEKEEVLFGIRQTIKNKKNLKRVFVPKDAREETIKRLESEGIEFTTLKAKEEMAKELNLDFGCEVFSIKSGSKKKETKKKK